MNQSFKITFITPCFCRGADCSDTGEPEIRPSSIRGQLHWWFRALGGSPADENSIFGNVHGGGSASKVVVRVKYALNAVSKQEPTLPHKGKIGAAAIKKAIVPGVSFELLISTRLGGLSSDLEKKFNWALDAWLHLGALGLRATRGGGNFTWEKQPQTTEEYRANLRKITDNTELIAELSHTSYKNAEAARKVITDTLSYKAFSEHKFPLGAVRQWKNDSLNVPSRKTSPLRFRIVKLGDKFYIAAIWDGRENVTGNNNDNFENAIDILKEKPIGKILDECFPVME